MIDFNHKNIHDIEYLKEVSKYFRMIEHIDYLKNNSQVSNESRSKACSVVAQFRNRFNKFRNSSPKYKQVIKWMIYKNQFNCWYCGMDFHLDGDPFFTPSIEHVEALANGGLDHCDNKVVAIRGINNMVGNAPITVKEHIKDALHKIKYHPNCSSNDKKKIIIDTIKDVMNIYRIEGMKQYPWDFDVANNVVDKKMEKSRRNNRLALIERLGNFCWM
jgi:hypothetical protein